MHGKLIGIAVRTKSRAPMQELEQATISAETGVERDFRGRSGPRQVTVMSADQWRDACAELQAELPWTMRRANLLIEGFDFNESAGATVTIGDVVLRVTGETEPCHRMDEQHAGLCQALVADWRAGVCCQVESGGRIAVGDAVELTRGT